MLNIPEVRSKQFGERQTWQAPTGARGDTGHAVPALMEFTL